VIPPIEVHPTTIGYTADALRLRIADVALAVEHLARAATALVANTPRTNGTVVGELQSITAELRTMQDDLNAILVTIEPSESARSNDAQTALAGFGGLVAMAPLAVRAFVDGTAWAPLRALSAYIESTTPWNAPTSGVIAVERIDEPTVQTAPATMAERVNRIPRGDDRIRIERFVDDAGERFEVYIGGTDFTAMSNDPWWAGSNIDLLSSGRSRSVIAVAEAMRLAGVNPSTPVVLTGHSQGGAIALALAKTESWNVDAVFTVGTPIGLIGDAPNVPTFHVEHPSDIVPALGGTPAEATGTVWLGIPSERQWGIDAHLWTTYRDTAARIDASAPPGLTAVERTIARTGHGTVTNYRVASSW
jgi:hypothetical protein